MSKSISTVRYFLSGQIPKNLAKRKHQYNNPTVKKSKIISKNLLHRNSAKRSSQSIKHIISRTKGPRSTNTQKKKL